MSSLLPMSCRLHLSAVQARRALSLPYLSCKTKGILLDHCVHEDQGQQPLTIDQSWRHVHHSPASLFSLFVEQQDEEGT